jgi:glycosyltransferase involved in cell wall biosynthesis
VARLIRRGLAARGGGEEASIAVMCGTLFRYASSQAIGLSETGLDVTLYYVDRRLPTENDEDRAMLLGRASAAGVHLVPVPRPRTRALLKDALWLRRDLRRRGIATAVVQSHRDARYAALGLCLRVVLMLHDPEPHSGDDDRRRALRLREKLWDATVPRAAELSAACLIVHSPRLLEQVRPLLRRVPIGVVAHGAEMAGSPAPVPRERRLLVFGRLEAYKGVDTALEAFERLPPELSDVELIVAGRGPLARLAIGRRNVEVRNEYIPESELDSLLRDARLVLLPYKDATQSGVGLHAVERGVPCVVSSAGGLPELVEDVRASLVVAPEDPQGLADSIVANIDHDEGLRQAVYDYAAQHFAWPVVAQRLRDEVHRLAP